MVDKRNLYWKILHINQVGFCCNIIKKHIFWERIEEINYFLLFFEAFATTLGVSFESTFVGTQIAGSFGVVRLLSPSTCLSLIKASNLKNDFKPILWFQDFYQLETLLLKIFLNESSPIIFHTMLCFAHPIMFQ